ncbi:MAG TPA: hypothetical protein PKU96_01905 [bacterium]|nr:hypothetical protein [Myxococcales bacterium]OQA62441.1 MAG: hypothetical protein BWY40_00010 [bacterium ADurb.Bin270]HPW45107.1 hypothetical protein [bacterium]HQH80835.1 hypothetical protein [bacterium]
MYLWLILGAVFTAILFAGLFYIHLSDRRYEKKKTSEVFSPELKEEIEAEREGAAARREKFMKFIEAAKSAEDPDKTVQ